MRPFADRRQVWWVGRRRGLTAHTTMADIADDYATALQPVGRRSPRCPRRLDRWQRCPAAGRRPPAPRPAARPGLIRLPTRSARAGRPAPGPGGARVASAPRGRRHAHASGGGRAVQRGRPGCARVARAAHGRGGGRTDLRATIRAEDGFDVTSRLATIQVPTLVVGGDRDAFYGEEVFRETARPPLRASCCCTGARGTWACGGTAASPATSTPSSADRRGCPRVTCPAQSGPGPLTPKTAVPGKSRPRRGDQPPQDSRLRSGHSGSTRSRSTRPAAVISRTRSPIVRWCST